MPTEREEFMAWLRQLIGPGVSADELDEMWRRRARDGSAAERYRRAVESYPYRPQTEDNA